jgi:hypothetical protein
MSRNIFVTTPPVRGAASYQINLELVTHAVVEPSQVKVFLASKLEPIILEGDDAERFLKVFGNA